MTTLSRRIGTILECVNFPFLRHSVTEYNASVLSARGRQDQAKAQVVLSFDPNQTKATLVEVKDKRQTKRVVTVTRVPLTDFVEHVLQVNMNNATAQLEVTANTSAAVAVRFAQLGYSDSELTVTAGTAGHLTLSVAKDSPNFFGAPASIGYVVSNTPAVSAVTSNCFHAAGKLHISPVKKVERNTVTAISRNDYPFSLKAKPTNAFEQVLKLPTLEQARHFTVTLSNPVTNQKVQFSFTYDMSSISNYNVAITEEMANATAVDSVALLPDSATLRFFATNTDYGFQVVGASTTDDDYVSTVATRGSLGSIFADGCVFEITGSMTGETMVQLNHTSMYLTAL